MHSVVVRILALSGVALAVCPYMDGTLDTQDSHYHSNRDVSLEKRGNSDTTKEFLAQFELNDTDVFLTSDVGGPIEDQTALKAGPRGPTLMEDFIFRQKIQHFDHERVSRTYATLSEMALTIHRSQKEQFTLEELVCWHSQCRPRSSEDMEFLADLLQVPMERLRVTEIGVISPQLRSSTLLGNKLRCFSGFLLLQAPGVVLIQLEMSMGLPLDSTLTRAILVSLHIEVQIL